MREINGINITEPGDGYYPEQLENIDNPPAQLYCKGDASLLSGEMFAVVGTRTITRYGKEVTEMFARELAVAGLIIVSGLARGVDSVAHKAALDCGRPTVAVLGNGFNHIYPAENRELYAEIEKHGLLVSEYAPDVGPQQWQFPQRNRIISGLSKGVLATEGGINSGSLITLNMAIEQGRDAFAVPGSILTKQSKGTNDFIREIPYAMVLEPNDILEKLGYSTKESRPSDVQLDINEQLIVAELENEPKHIEELVDITNISYNNLLTLLSLMEVKGIIKSLPGNYYSV